MAFENIVGQRAHPTMFSTLAKTELVIYKFLLANAFNLFKSKF